MSWTAMVFMIALASGAGQEETQPQADPAQMVMHGLDLYMHRADPTYGELRDPTIWVHADRGELMSDQRVWSLENPKAVIYREPEENLHLEARSGAFDQTRQRAVLREGVRATSGPMTVTLEDIEWDNANRVARSDVPAALSDGTNELTGASVAIFPEDNRIELGAGSGKIRLAAERASLKPREADAARKMHYDTIELTWRGEIVGNLSGSIRHITKGAHMVLTAPDPEDNLIITAESVEFEYGTDNQSMPIRMTLDGDVVFTHRDGVIRAQHVDLDFDAGEAKFTGNPTVDNAQIQGVETSYITLNLDTREFVMGPGRIERIQLSTDAAESNETGDRP